MVVLPVTRDDDDDDDDDDDEDGVSATGGGDGVPSGLQPFWACRRCSITSHAKSPWWEENTSA